MPHLNDASANLYTDFWMSVVFTGVFSALSAVVPALIFLNTLEVRLQKYSMILHRLRVHPLFNTFAEVYQKTGITSRYFFIEVCLKCALPT